MQKVLDRRCLRDVGDRAFRIISGMSRRKAIFYVHLRVGPQAKDSPIGLQAIPSSESNLVKLLHGKATDSCRQDLSLALVQKVFLQDNSSGINGLQADQRANVTSSISRVIVQAGTQRLS